MYTYNIDVHIHQCTYAYTYAYTYVKKFTYTHAYTYIHIYLTHIDLNKPVFVYVDFVFGSMKIDGYIPPSTNMQISSHKSDLEPFF